MPGMKYTEEMRQFILDNYKGVSSKDLAEKFNDRFGTQISKSQMAYYRKNHHLISGLCGQFEKGHTPVNKGKKMSPEQYEKSKATMFKKGQMPMQYKPVGSETERWFDHAHTKKCIWVKIADPDVWREKHDLVWEAHNGPIPKGHALIFLDGNTLNPSIDNLALVDRYTNLLMNKNGLRYNEKEATKTGLLIAEVIKAGHAKRKRQSEDRK